jgi:hypothetical protein
VIIDLPFVYFDDGSTWVDPAFETHVLLLAHKLGLPAGVNVDVLADELERWAAGVQPRLGRVQLSGASVADLVLSEPVSSIFDQSEAALSMEGDPCVMRRCRLAVAEAVGLEPDPGSTADCKAQD